MNVATIIYGNKVKIIDSFSFNGEMDLLEIRLNILDEYVDTFVICESDETFTGKPKPLYYEENKERYKKWHHKIKLFKMSKPTPELMADCQKSPGVPQNLHWWVREFCQKESIRYALKESIKKAITWNEGDKDFEYLWEEPKADDLIFIGDADEIWNPKHIPPYGRWKLEQTVYAYYLNNRSSEWWEGTSVMPYSEIKKDTLDNLRAHDTHREYMKAPTYPNNGWHFTNLGGAEFVKRKLASYSHQEFNHLEITEKIEQRIKENKDFIGRDFTFTIDETGLPDYILNNRNKYKNLWKV